MALLHKLLFAVGSLGRLISFCIQALLPHKQLEIVQRCAPGARLPGHQETAGLGRLYAIAVGFVWSAMACFRLECAMSQTTLSECTSGVSLQLGWTQFAARRHCHQVPEKRRMEVQKHGAERRRQWHKLHIGIDAQALQVRAICVTSNNVSDAVAAMP